MKKIGLMLLGVLGLLVISMIVLAFLSKTIQIPNFKLKAVIAKYESKKPIGYSPEIEPYIDYLKSVPNNNPVDYVINLFDKYDIVVLCERFHHETTQYELIGNIISDKRFIEKSGCVFTEVGNQSMNDRLNVILQTKGLKEKELDRQILSLYRDIPWPQSLESYNYYSFFKKVYSLNNTLSDNQKVRIYTSDTPELQKIGANQRYLRDEGMADFIINKYEEIEKSKSLRKKALVIMNYYHAYKVYNGMSTEYLNKEFPGKVANVLINTVKILPGLTVENTMIAPIQNGKWDAAFRYLNNMNTAFDLTNTPFGEDYFDHYDSQYKYKDIFNGFIFYKSLEKHKFAYDIYKKIEVYDYDIPKYLNEINHWLKY